MCIVHWVADLTSFACIIYRDTTPLVQSPDGKLVDLSTIIASSSLVGKTRARVCTINCSTQPPQSQHWRRRSLRTLPGLLSGSRLSPQEIVGHVLSWTPRQSCPCLLPISGESWVIPELSVKIYNFSGGFGKQRRKLSSIKFYWFCENNNLIS